jgi:hypothetical protein
LEIQNYISKTFTQTAISKSFIKYTIWTTLRTSIYFLELKIISQKKNLKKYKNPKVQIVYKIHYLDNFEDIHILFGNSKLYLKKHFSKKYKNPKGLFSKSFIKYTIWTTLRTSIYFLEIQNYLSKKHFSKNIKTQNGYFQIVYKIYYLDNFKDNLYTFWKFKIISQKTFKKKI